MLRVALNPEQVDEYGLVQNPDLEVQKKLEDDPRAVAFQRRFGSLVQYEVDGLPPESLRSLYRSAIDEYWDESRFKAVRAREKRESKAL